MNNPYEPPKEPSEDYEAEPIEWGLIAGVVCVALSVAMMWLGLPMWIAGVLLGVGALQLAASFQRRQ